MNPATWKTIKETFASALELPEPERDRFLANSNDEIRLEVEKLLSTYQEAQTFIGTPLIVEATTSWSYVGAGLRLTMELLGPEYSMSVSTLDGGAKVFFSRRLQEQAVGEDLIEKQNAEQGLMPIVGNMIGRVDARRMLAFPA